MNVDLIIVNGTLVDGSGKPGIKADLAVSGERIYAIGDLSGVEAAHVLDAAGKMVCPGFIDVHVHSELALLGGIDRYAPLKMGVTTQLAAPDGFSWAPLGKDRFQEMKEYLHVFYEDQLLDGREQLSIEEYLALFRGNLPSNLVLQVPHQSIRAAVVGWDPRPAADEEIERMEQLVRQWLDLGAVSFCTGLEYEPMSQADTRELVRLSKVAAEYGVLYVAHQRGYGPQLARGCEETFAIAEQAGIPVHISHLAIDDLAEAQLNEAQARGIDVSFDMYPYPAGCTHLLRVLPDDMQVGPPQEIKKRLQDPAARKAMASHLQTSIALDRCVFAAVGSESPTGLEGKSMGQVVEELGMSLEDAVSDILLQTDLQALMIYHWLPERVRFLQKTFTHPLGMVSTDGIYVGKKPHPRGFGTFPKVLGEYVRDKKWLSFEEAVWKMSGYPAQRFRIRERGLLKEGYYADIVVVDPQTVAGPATFEQPRLEPAGIEQVIVNGKLAMQNGQPTDGLWGKRV